MFKRYNRIKKFLLLGVVVISTFYLASCNKSNEDSSTIIFKNVNEEIEQRNYFSFYNYEYKLDITRQKSLLKESTNLSEGLRESYCWYKNNKDKVNRKAYLDFINKNFE